MPSSPPPGFTPFDPNSTGVIPALLRLGAWVAKEAALLAVSKLAQSLTSSAPSKPTPTTTPATSPPAPATTSEKGPIGRFGENRGHSIEFAYDASGPVKITELANNVITSKKLYFWIGGTIVCERDGLQPNFPITKRFFSQGVVQRSDKIYYTRDHLGSIREVVDATGAVHADYRYTTYRERTRQSGDLDTEWAYAGFWHHAPSGLDLATHRIYDSSRGRWLSRDRLGKGTDRTLYSYVGNSPVNFSDPTGLIQSSKPQLFPPQRRPNQEFEKPIPWYQSWNFDPKVDSCPADCIANYNVKTYMAISEEEKEALKQELRDCVDKSKTRWIEFTDFRERRPPPTRNGKSPLMIWVPLGVDPNNGF